MSLSKKGITFVAMIISIPLSSSFSSPRPKVLTHWWEPEVYWATTPCSGKILKIILRTNPSCLYAYTFTSRESSKFPSHEILSPLQLWIAPHLIISIHPWPHPYSSKIYSYLQKNFCHQQNFKRVYCSEIFLWLLILCKICLSLSVSISLLLQHLQ